MNQVILVGRLVTDPELHVLDSGVKVTTVTLAVKRPFKSGETNESNVIPIVTANVIFSSLPIFCLRLLKYVLPAVNAIMG